MTEKVYDGHRGLILKLTMPGDSQGIILTNTYVVESNGERTSYLMFYFPRGLMERFSGGFLISVSLFSIDVVCFI